MLSHDDVRSILSLILAKYQSLENPYFFFVKDTVAQQPYQELISQIQNIFDVDEDTDLNIDVSFQYILSRHQQQWGLQLSMVGPYAAILRIVTNGEILEVIDPATYPLSPVEMELIQTLERHGVRVLDEASLEIPVPVKLWYTSPENTHLYHALFGDYDPLPWK